MILERYTFRTRLTTITLFSRLYERLNHTNAGPVALIATAPGMEPMAKDLIDDESDLSDSNMEILDYPG